jgi:adenosylhomocysteine/aminodeoxyfutalosine nucleosidase
MKIGLLIACGEEINAHLKYFDKIKTLTFGEMTFYKAKFKNHTIVLCKSGPCEINAGIYLQKMLDFFKPDVIINSGTCGSLDEKNKVCDTFVVDKATFWDIKSDIIEPSTYVCDEKLKNFALSLDKKLKVGNLVTGNSFVESEGLKKKLIKNFGANICDMEGVAVVYTCQKNYIPCLLLKSVSDSGNMEEFEKNFRIASEKVASVTFKIMENLSKKNLN